MAESIGVRLKRAREERRLTIAQAASATRIRSHYLEALERDDLSSVPSVAQARGFLRIYADFLSLDPGASAPQARSPETLPPPEPAVAPADLSPVSDQEAVPAPQPPPRNLLLRLRGRLLRAQPGSDDRQQPSEGKAIASEPQTPVTVPEPFVPVRSKEEFPEMSAPLVDQERTGEIPTVKRSTRGERPGSGSAKNKAAKFSSPEAESPANNLMPPGAGNEDGKLKKKIR